MCSDSSGVTASSSSNSPITDILELWVESKDGNNNSNILKDRSGNSNDLTLVNLKGTTDSGFRDNVLVLDGIDNYLYLPKTSKSIYTLSSLGKTIEIHYKKSVAFPADKSKGIIGFINAAPYSVMEGSSENPFKFGTITQSDSSTSDYCLVAQTSNHIPSIDLNNTLPTGDIHEIYVLTATEAKLYRNGVLLSTLTLDSVPRVINTPFVIGALLNNNQPLNGSYTNLELISARVYGKALTLDEINYNFAYEKVFNS